MEFKNIIISFKAGNLTMKLLKISNYSRKRRNSLCILFISNGKTQAGCGATFLKDNPYDDSSAAESAFVSETHSFKNFEVEKKKCVSKFLFRLRLALLFRCINPSVHLHTAGWLGIR